MISSADATQRSSSDLPVSLVSINARRAEILRWRDGQVMRLVIPSEVPGRHRSTGHVRHDPRVRHGGSGVGQDEMERQRLERIAQFLAHVTDALRAEERILVLGSGRLPAELAKRLDDAERGRPRRREIRREQTGYLTERQLRARLLVEAGEPPRRRAVRQRPQVGSLRRSLGRTPARDAAEVEAEVAEVEAEVAEAATG